VRRASVGLVAAAVAAAAVCAGAAARATATFADTIRGYEYAASSSSGSFAGVASGALPGVWDVRVHHVPLCLSCTPTAKIDGGSVALKTRIDGKPALIRGAFASGTVQVTNPGAGCTSQTFTVAGVLRSVGRSGHRTGSGAFSATLTHHRLHVLGRCITYAASVRGTLSVSF